MKVCQHKIIKHVNMTLHTLLYARCIEQTIGIQKGRHHSCEYAYRWTGLRRQTSNVRWSNPVGRQWHDRRAQFVGEISQRSTGHEPHIDGHCLSAMTGRYNGRFALYTKLGACKLIGLLSVCLPAYLTLTTVKNDLKLFLSAISFSIFLLMLAYIYKHLLQLMI